MLEKFSAAALAVALLLSAGTIGAQENYPSKPVRFIVPFSAGSSPDIMTRMLGKELEVRLGQSMIVEARPGGNSTLGASQVAKSPADGYTVLWAASSATSSARAMFKTLTYDPINDFAAINIYAEAYFTLMVGAEYKGTSLGQFLDQMRKNPQLNSMGGTGSTVEIISKMIDAAAKTKHTHVRYSNTANMVTDTISGRLGVAIHTFSQSVPLVRSGKAHVLAVSAPVVLRSLPDAPPIAATLPGVSIGTFNGYFVPAKTPRPIIGILHKQTSEIFKLPLFVERIEEAGRIISMSPEEADAYVRSEEKRWTSLAKMAGIEPE